MTEQPLKEMNYNLLANTNFRLEINVVNAEPLNYFIQDTALPSITMSGIETPYQNLQGFVPANRIDYDPLSCNFLVSEDLENYLFLYNWMHDIRDDDYPNQWMRTATLHILNNNRLSNILVKFHGLFPTSLSSIELMSNVNSPTPIICNASFTYQYFEIQLKNGVVR